MRTDKPIGATAVVADIMGAMGGDAGRSTAVDPGRVCGRCLADACGGLCGHDYAVLNSTDM